MLHSKTSTFLQYVFLLFILIFASPILSTQNYEKHYLTIDDVIKRSFSDPASIMSHEISLSDSQKIEIESQLGMTLDSDTYRVYLPSNNSDSEGYLFVIDEMGKYHPITLAVHISSDKTVGNVFLLTYRERIGSEVRKPRFLKQFIGKNSTAALQVDNDIDGISGATISSWSVSTAVKKVLLITQYIYSEKVASI
jgi:Na+-translocating ferredoxin:NAD+ oxidoreductase RnfG subunit